MSYLANTETVTLLGTIVAFVGTVILAFSMIRVFWELRLALNAISITIERLVSGGDVPVFRGLETRISDAMKTSKWLTSIGLLLVVIAIPIQGCSLYLNSSSIDKLESAIKKSIELSNNNKRTVDRAIKSLQKHQSEIGFLKSVVESNEQAIKAYRDDFNNKLKELESDIVPPPPQ